MKKFKEKIDNMSKKDLVVVIIVTLPVALIILDGFNIPSMMLPIYKNMAQNGTWVLAIITLASSMISAMLLVLITEKDREANTNSIRESQRPYLDVSYMKIDREGLEELSKEKDVICFAHGNSADKKIKQDEYLTLQIVNNGLSVAIFEINETTIRLTYNNGKQVEEEFKLNTVINRLSIKSGATVYIKLCKASLYKNGKLDENSGIIHSTLSYKDLFNKKYIDECKMDSDKIEVIRDNEPIQN